MKEIIKKRNVKAHIELPKKGNSKTEFAITHTPNLKPKNKRAK